MVYHCPTCIIYNVVLYMYSLILYLFKNKARMQREVMSWHGIVIIDDYIWRAIDEFAKRNSLQLVTCNRDQRGYFHCAIKCNEIYTRNIPSNVQSARHIK